MSDARFLLIGVLLLAIAPLARLVPSRHRSAPRSVGPVLVLDGSQAHDADAGTRATTLLLRSLSTRGRNELAAALDDLATGLETKANPLVADLLDVPPDEALGRIAPVLLPALTAAESLSSRRFVSADGTLGASLAAKCPPAARCIALWGRDDSKVASSARFLAWAWSRAIVVRARDADAAPWLDRFRDRIALPTSKIALVVAARDLDVGDPDGAASIRKDAATAQRIFARTTIEAPLIALLARPAIAPARALGLPRDAVVIVPKLSALVDPKSFAEEAAHHLAALGANVSVTFGSLR